MNKKKKKPVMFDTSLPQNIPLLMKMRAREYPTLTCQASKNADGVFVSYSYKEVYRFIIAAAIAFRKIGISRGDNVGIISDNRREWLISDLAILSLGAADVPRGCDSVAQEIRYILSFSECKASIFETSTQLKKVLDAADEVPLLKTAVLFEKPTDEILAEAEKHGVKVYHFNEIFEEAMKLLDENPHLRAEIEFEMENTSCEEVATLIFTSGTTGVPKGVMLTHRNFISELEVIHYVFPAEKGDMWLSVLPVWHSFERLVQYAVILLKTGIAYSKPVGQIMLADMGKIRPQLMCGVPRLWESVAKGIFQAMKKKGGASYVLFRFFVGVGEKFSVLKDMVTGCVSRFHWRSRTLDFLIALIPFILLWPIYKLGDLLVFSKLRQKFGGRFRAGVSGGGALPRDIERFYRACGINLLEGYGMTETAPVLAVRYMYKSRPGCVGTIFPSMEVRVVAEENGVIKSMDPLPPGEKGLILTRGEQVMKGYYKRPDLTAAIIDKDGWLNTGDLGSFTFDDEIRITGRAKDTIVLLGGENVEPAPIERAICESNFIESAVVMGQDKRGLVALIVPEKTAIENYAKENAIAYESYEKLLENEQVSKLINDEIETQNSKENGFRAFERIFTYKVLSESFKVGEELSIKMEYARFKIAAKYNDVLEELYKKLG